MICLPLVPCFVLQLSGRVVITLWSSFFSEVRASAPLPASPDNFVASTGLLSVGLVVEALGCGFAAAVGFWSVATNRYKK